MSTSATNKDNDKAGGSTVGAILFVNTLRNILRGKGVLPYGDPYTLLEGSNPNQAPSLVLVLYRAFHWVLLQAHCLERF